MALKSQTSTVWATTKFHKPWKINSGSFCFLSSVTRFPQNDSLSICLVGMATPQPQHDTPWLLKIEDGFQTECVLLLLLGFCVCVSVQNVFFGEMFFFFWYLWKICSPKKKKHVKLEQNTMTWLFVSLAHLFVLLREALLRLADSF